MADLLLLQIMTVPLGGNSETKAGFRDTVFFFVAGEVTFLWSYGDWTVVHSMKLILINASPLPPPPPPPPLPSPLHHDL